MRYYAIHFNDINELRYIMSKVCKMFDTRSDYQVCFLKKSNYCFEFIIGGVTTFICVIGAGNGYLYGTKVLGSYSTTYNAFDKPESVYEWIVDKHKHNVALNTIERTYINNDIKATADFFTYPQIKKVIFNDPATIVFWSDGSKTVVKAQTCEFYDPEKGLAMAIAKKWFGNKGNYYNNIKKWLPKEDI